ncbi:hypothetical protein N9137_01125 [Pseudomonadales bacterium]|nr:hypothetical protein [Pseudomonadales bacterium]
METNIIYQPEIDGIVSEYEQYKAAHYHGISSLVWDDINDDSRVNYVAYYRIAMRESALIAEAKIKASKKDK